VRGLPKSYEIMTFNNVSYGNPKSNFEFFVIKSEKKSRGVNSVPIISYWPTPTIGIEVPGY
jgi:hypothetical protein